MGLWSISNGISSGNPRNCVKIVNPFIRVLKTKKVPLLL